MIGKKKVKTASLRATSNSVHGTCRLQEATDVVEGRGFFFPSEGGVFSLSIHFLISLSVFISLSLSPSPCSILTAVHKKNDFLETSL